MGTEAPARLVPVCQRNSRSTTETTQWVNSAEERSSAVGAVRGSLSHAHWCGLLSAAEVTTLLSVLQYQCVSGSLGPCLSCYVESASFVCVRLSLSLCLFLVQSFSYAHTESENCVLWHFYRMREISKAEASWLKTINLNKLIINIYQLVIF